LKQDLRVVKTQENLRRALLTLLKSKPLETITVAELCRHANINRGTFYLHYKDVLEVFKKYFEVIVEDFGKAYVAPYYKTNFKIEKITEDMVQIFHHVKKYQDFYQIIFNERIPTMYYYLLFDTVRTFIKDNIDVQSLMDTYDVNVDYLISYQANAILGLLVEWHRQDYKTPIKVLNKQLLIILSINSPFRK
jgi:AcrR family transcriptional regulator